MIVLANATRNVARYRAVKIGMSLRGGGYSSWSVVSLVFGTSAAAFSMSSEGEQSVETLLLVSSTSTGSFQPC